MAKKKEEIIESLGVLLEKTGKTPIESRVVSSLLVSNPPECTFDDLVESLQASKSAISNALKSLQRVKTIKYSTKAGDRKRYFQIDTENWVNQLNESSNRFGRLNDLLEEVIDYRSSLDSEVFNKKIIEILDFQLFVSEKLKLAIEEWNKR